MDLGYSPDGLIHAGRAIDNLDTSYHSLAKLFMAHVTFLGHYGLLRLKYSNQYAVGGEEAFS